MDPKSKHDLVVELVNKLFVYTDRREWTKLREEVFADEVSFDMSSMGAGTASKMKPKEICDMWNKGFEGIDHVHHQAGNFLVNFLNDNVEAEISCYAVASHFRRAASKGQTREFVGTYDLHAIFTDLGWRLDGFRYNLKFATGNTDLK